MTEPNAAASNGSKPMNPLLNERTEGVQEIWREERQMLIDLAVTATHETSNLMHQIRQGIHGRWDTDTDELVPGTATPEELLAKQAEALICLSMIEHYLLMFGNSVEAAGSNGMSELIIQVFDPNQATAAYNEEPPY